MREVLTSAQMRGLEFTAISQGATGTSLMASAARGVAAAIAARWPQAGSAIVLCGPGNNGGDGYLVARLLQNAGWQVRVCALAPPFTPDAQVAAMHWGGVVCAPGDLDAAAFGAADLVVDAMFGIGLTRPIAPGIWELLAMAQAAGCGLVAVDILSGICADTGRILADSGYIVRPADLTVTFHRAKLGHHLGPGAELSGGLEVVPLGLERLVQPQAVALVTADAEALRKQAGHKFDHGHVVVIAGGVGRGGAARLSARAALRIGAGLVTLCCPAAALAENAARLDAVMLRPLTDAAALQALLEDARIRVLCLGPGLGLGDLQRDLLAVALRSGRRLVLDADALTLLARAPELLGLLHRGCVLTPHGGEFARLFPDLALMSSKVDAARAAAVRAGCVVLYKGADTVIAAPDGRVQIHSAYRDRAAPWLATAGAGDVLAGIIAGLLARGLPAMEAAAQAAWLHVEAALLFGPGLIAEDLPDMLPLVLRGLLGQKVGATGQANSTPPA